LKAQVLKAQVLKAQVLKSQVSTVELMPLLQNAVALRLAAVR
jgi:hypothetical protein